MAQIPFEKKKKILHRTTFLILCYYLASCFLYLITKNPFFILSHQILRLFSLVLLVVYHIIFYIRSC